MGLLTIYMGLLKMPSTFSGLDIKNIYGPIKNVCVSKGLTIHKRVQHMGQLETYMGQLKQFKYTLWHRY